MGPASYEVDADQVPEAYRHLFNNADWTVHKFVVYGSWGFFVVAIVAHVLAYSYKPFI
ncbi:light-harvesting protein [Vulcanimicrobium alpinum]|uniref:light-harvesting protein n=1 Tax=Vulcanimicrobium alpinum TaxID=3016050 RepID=UPI00295E7CCF|nr:light-harvesting protein [Vulcanimicrobium alpinum]